MRDLLADEILPELVKVPDIVDHFRGHEADHIDDLSVRIISDCSDIMRRDHAAVGEVVMNPSTRAKLPLADIPAILRIRVLHLPRSRRKLHAEDEDQEPAGDQFGARPRETPEHLLSQIKKRTDPPQTEQ